MSSLCWTLSELFLLYYHVGSVKFFGCFYTVTQSFGNLMHLSGYVKEGNSWIEYFPGNLLC